MKVLIDFLPIYEISTTFYCFDFLFTSMTNNGSQNVFLNVLINEMGFLVLMVNSGIKRAFKYEKRH